MRPPFAKREKVVAATFYQTPAGDEPVRTWFKGSMFGNEDRKVIGADIQVVEHERPKVSGRGLVKGLGRGLWEVRSTLPSHRIARVLFGVAEGRMVILHGFIKKTPKTPAADLRLARDRWREWKRV